jgi:hypothetical protein
MIRPSEEEEQEWREENDITHEPELLDFDARQNHRCIQWMAMKSCESKRWMTNTKLSGLDPYRSKNIPIGRISMQTKCWNANANTDIIEHRSVRSAHTRVGGVDAAAVLESCHIILILAGS